MTISGSRPPWSRASLSAAQGARQVAAAVTGGTAKPRSRSAFGARPSLPDASAKVAASRNSGRSAWIAGPSLGRLFPDRLGMPAQPNTRLQLPTFANECSEADPVLGGDHLRSLLANHNRRRIRVSGDHRRHDARVRHTQLADPPPH